MINNPVLRGFCPDPSIIRVGEEYYIATSTFEWWPGVKLFHSKDLCEFRQVASPLRRKSQLDMVGNPTSGGVWAPCLSYDGKYFYLLYTDVKTKKGRYYNTHNYLVYTEDILGEWSDPVYLNSIGFDPSLFHDSDGKKYLINMVNGFRGILVQEIEPESFRLIGERKKVYDGSGIGCTEGPHMYHIGEWYYLLTAEGGTGYDHCVSLARSKSVWGPFETAPNNPILTSKKEASHTGALQKCGHGDLVETSDGQWYLAHLCARPAKEGKGCILGRETAIQKVCWDSQGWLFLEDGSRYGKSNVKAPCKKDDCCGNMTRENITQNFYDDFSSETFSMEYSSPRVSYLEFAEFTKGDSGEKVLRITGQESLNSLHHVSLLAVRQKEFHAKAETKLKFTPLYQEQLAGLAYMYDALNFYIFGKTICETGESVITLLKSDSGIITDEMLPIMIPEHEKVLLQAKVEDHGSRVRFYYGTETIRLHEAGDGFTTKIVTDEHCRGFTGAHFGMYVHDMTGEKCSGEFSYFQVVYEGGGKDDCTY